MRDCVMTAHVCYLYLNMPISISHTGHFLLFIINHWKEGWEGSEGKWKGSGGKGWVVGGGGKRARAGGEGREGERCGGQGWSTTCIINEFEEFWELH
jgi:hypothetical protein